MRKSTIVAIVTAFILTSVSICFAQESDDQTGKMGTMMSGKSRMGRQGMSGQDMMGRDHMGRGMMRISMVATQDGGVVVMIGNRLYKYDQNLSLKKETEISVDYEGLKGMMMKMQNMGMGMAPSEDTK
ncbi:MAG: hypothetical protein K9K21_02545 [Desulfotignum sp.]|nr:hypothetical protein [Desulfotignum sp.]